MHTVFHSGAMDARSYISEDLWEGICKEVGYTNTALRDSRYDCVIHLVCALYCVCVCAWGGMLCVCVLGVCVVCVCVHLCVCECGVCVHCVCVFTRVCVIGHGCRRSRAILHYRGSCC